MRLLTISTAAMALSISAVAAQPTSHLGDNAARKQETKRLTAKPAPARSCAEFGPGFMMLEGSATCVRVGGSISVGVGGGTGRGR